MTAPSLSPAVLPRVFGGVSVTAEWQHCSWLFYAVPAERVRALLPRSFEAAELTRRRRQFALLSVMSFVDRGHQSAEAASSGGHGLTGFCGAFEQTNYCLHARRQGEPCDWLLGLSLGSLSAIAPRRLWPLPWHLSAMAVNVDYARAAKRYRTYRVQTQSQWANARWEMSDTGWPLDAACLAASGWSSSLPRERATYFTRRDGALGVYQTEFSPLTGTRAHLEFGQCDLLERLGLLTSEEASRPYLAALQPSFTCQIYSSSTTNFAQEHSPGSAGILPASFGHSGEDRAGKMPALPGFSKETL